MEVAVLPPPLPDILPGALPSLQGLVISTASHWPAHALPAGWGRRPDVLPLLQSLHLQLPRGIARLPAAWAQGFRQLESLSLSTTPLATFRSSAPDGFCPGMPPPSDGAPSGLPPEWAVGFPALEALTLVCLPLAGPLPPEWHGGSFPALADL
jgi:hypothetical protein